MESKLGRIGRNLKRRGSRDQGQPRFKNRAQTQEEPWSAKVILGKGAGSQNRKPICITCGKGNYGKFLKGTNNFFGCCKEGHK